MSKIEAYNPISKSSFHLKFDEAHALTASNQAKWDGNKRIILNTDQRIKVTWAPKQSGSAGPLVMQVVG